LAARFAGHKIKVGNVYTKFHGDLQNQDKAVRRLTRPVCECRFHPNENGRSDAPAFADASLLRGMLRASTHQVVADHCKKRWKKLFTGGGASVIAKRRSRLNKSGAKASAIAYLPCKKLHRAKN